jgi:carbonic anhydrase
MKKLALLVAALLLLPALARAEGAHPDFDAIVADLMAGNARYVRGDKGQLPRIDDKRRAELVAGQAPKAIVLSCSDSRVPPEHVFRQGLGDIFVARIAGNVPMSGMVASIEYAVEHLHAPVIFVLGHASCGAVKATVAQTQAATELTPDLTALVNEIMPAVTAAEAHLEPGQSLVDAAIHENALLAAEHLLERSEVVRRAVEAHEVRVLVGLYDLATGKVTIIEKSVEPR